ncbi:rhombosortase [Ideonella sp.]|uniref:rhombosortase n=1 Tax=Ideonella sp. TaxID=1929293 RepID=UPI003BB7241E
MTGPVPSAWGERLRSGAWPALALSLALFALALFNQATEAWDWQPALAGTEPWRAWTAAAVHWTPAHLQMNLAGCAALAWLGWRADLGPREALAWALAWPLTQVGLLLQPALLHYGGLSGVLHAGVVLVAWGLVSQGGSNRWLGLIMAGGLLAKLISEQPWRAEVQRVPGYDFQVAPMAHSSGALAGLVCGALVLGWSRWQRGPSTAAPAPPMPAAPE